MITHARLGLAAALIALATACETPPTDLAGAPQSAAATAPAAEHPVTPMQGFSWVAESSLAAMPRPGVRRPLADDIAFLHEQGIALVVSLTEQPTDRAALAAAGIDLLHLPVPDFTAPTLEQLFTFLDALSRARIDGRAVAVHCTAGLGRTGTFMAAYFVSRGMTARAAIAEIRRLRPGSVETSAQELRVSELADALAE